MADQRHYKMKIWHIAIGAVVIALGFVVLQFLPENRNSLYERLVQKPIPKSVQLISEGKFVAMDSTFYVLQFRISKLDLQKLVEKQHFFLIDESKEFRRWDQSVKNYVQIEKGEYLESWKRRILKSTNLDVNVTNTWQIYIRNEGGGRKYIFSAPDGTDVVFIAEAN